MLGLRQYCMAARDPKQPLVMDRHATVESIPVDNIYDSYTSIYNLVGADIRDHWPVVRLYSR